MKRLLENRTILAGFTFATVLGVGAIAAVLRPTAVPAATTTIEFQAGQSLETLKAKYKRPAAPDYPSSNAFSEAKLELGKHLFFDPRLSRTGTVSCSSCHNPAFRWSDGLPLGRGVTGQTLPRRSPSVVNSAWLTVLMWDGRAGTLEQQAVLPMTAEHEMGMQLDEIVQRLRDISGYRPMFERAFPGEDVNAQSIVAALATYERSLISNEAPFDRWIAGDSTAIGTDAIRGFEIFNGVGRCSKCHSSWRFTDDSFHDVGLKSDDVGRGQFTPPSVVIMQHAFKTPSLRDLNVAGPYMHDGSMKSLEEVLKHYEDGGIMRPSLSPDMKAVTLSAEQRADLLAFLRTLSGPALTTEIPVLP